MAGTRNHETAVGTAPTTGNLCGSALRDSSLWSLLSKSCSLSERWMSPGTLNQGCLDRRRSHLHCEATALKLIARSRNFHTNFPEGRSLNINGTDH